MRTSAGAHDLLAFAVKKGIYLTLPQLKMIYQAKKWPYPDGSGPKGVKHRFKKDFARDLVARLWPDEPEEAQEEMYVALMGKGAYTNKDHDKCEEDLLEVISGLDPENAEAAKGVRKACWDMLSAKQEAAKKAMPTEWKSGWHKQNFTPPELRDLLPPSDSVVWIKRQPTLATYSGFYERHLALHRFK